MPTTRRFEVPADLADKLERMAKDEGKSAEGLLIQILRDHFEVTEFILRKAKERAGKQRATKAAAVRT